MIALPKGQKWNWKYAGICLSLANICYLHIWEEMRIYREIDSIAITVPPSSRNVSAVLLNVLLLASVFYAAAVWATGLSEKGRRIARWLALLMMAVPLNSIRKAFGLDLRLVASNLASPGGVVTASVLGVTVLLLIVNAPRLLRFAKTMVLVLLLLLPIKIVEAVRSSVRYTRPFQVSNATVSGTRVPGRVVWIIFDELDQRLAFAERPATLAMPEFDRFREQALYTTDAYPPANRTQTSMPSLITGRVFQDFHMDDSGQPLLALAGSDRFTRWSQYDNLFRKASSYRANTAVVGWYLPYCSVLGPLTECVSYTSAVDVEAAGGLTGAVVEQSRSLLESAVLSPFGQSMAIRKHVRLYGSILKHATKAAVDPTLQVVLLHLPVPHWPFIYDRVKGTLDLKYSPISAYVDNLALTDRTLGTLRSTMEAAGVWENTAVLVSSDHWFRASKAFDGKVDHRVPFLLKLAGQKKGATYEKQFNTIVTHDLILALLRHEIGTADEAAQWLDQRESAVSAALR